MSPRSPKRLAASLLAGLAMSLVLSACGGDSAEDSATQPTATQPNAAAEPGANTADFNDADVTFVQTMIPHHEQAVKMAELAATRASDPGVKKLAEEIKAAQEPEAVKMREFLKAWGKSEGMAGMDHGSGGMAGMMSDDDLTKMDKATGKEFDAMFLENMKEHHDGAIEAAKTEQSAGKNAEAKALADDVVSAQAAELERIDKLLNA